MTKELPLSSTPEWLMVLDADAMKKDNLPLRELLDGSLYYPAAGFDGNPVQYCTGDIYSFVYVDYSWPKDLLLEELNSDQNGFKGYKMLSWRGVAWPWMSWFRTVGIQKFCLVLMKTQDSISH